MHLTSELRGFPKATNYADPKCIAFPEAGDKKKNARPNTDTSAEGRHGTQYCEPYALHSPPCRAALLAPGTAGTGAQRIPNGGAEPPLRAALVGRVRVWLVRPRALRESGRPSRFSHWKPCARVNIIGELLNCFPPAVFQCTLQNVVISVLVLSGGF